MDSWRAYSGLVPSGTALDRRRALGDGDANAALNSDEVLRADNPKLPAIAPRARHLSVVSANVNWAAGSRLARGCRMSETTQGEPEAGRRFSDGHWWQWDGERWVMEPAPPGSVIGDSAPPTPVAAESSRRSLIIVAVVVGLVLLAAIAATGIFMARQAAEEQAVKDAAAAQKAAQEAVLKDAANECNLVSADGVSIGDGGRTISFDTQGEDDSSGASFDDVACILFAVDTPDAVISRIDSTRALDGTQTANWGSIAASWGYHPDSGMQLVLTTTGTQ